jgi:hypothetical protein
VSDIQPTETVEYELNTQQCVKVALYMYGQWQEAMKPPLFIYKSFPDWLAQLQQNTKEVSNE